MATNAPKSRRTHIARIFGTNKFNERLDYLYADLERIDVTKSVMNVPPLWHWLTLQKKLLWADNPDADVYWPDGLPSRLIDIVKLCDVTTQDPDDPEEWVPIPVIKGLKPKGGGPVGMGQGFMERFLTAVVDAELRTSRVFEVRKIVHYDTNIDALAQAAADADPDRRVFVVPGSQYEKDLSTKDSAQAVEHEIVLYLKPKGNTLLTLAQGQQIKLLNRYLVNESDDPSGEVVGRGGINPPYRFDHYQNVVNVSFTPTVVAVFVNDASAAPFGALTCEPQPDPASGKIKAEFLENFTVTIPGDTPLNIDCHAYKVPANAKSFMRTTMPTATDPVILPSAAVLVFALVPGQTDAISLARAKDSTRQALISLNTTEAGGIELGEVECPDGLLWWGQTMNQCAPGTKNDWTLRYGKHRNDLHSVPRNTMVQCYPVNQAPTTYEVPGPPAAHFTFKGYRIFYYRLDPKGAGQAYFVGNRDSNPGCAWNLDDAELIDIDPVNEDDPGSHLKEEGVLFGDPPPMIIADRPRP